VTPTTYVAKPVHYWAIKLPEPHWYGIGSKRRIQEYVQVDDRPMVFKHYVSAASSRWTCVNLRKYPIVRWTGSVNLDDIWLDVSTSVHCTMSVDQRTP